MPECEKCGTEYQKGDLFCGRCGARLYEKMEPDTKKPEGLEPAPSKKELSDDVKEKLKKELEISIRAFKKGEINLEEFQSIKQGILAKAKAGFYDEPLPTEIADKEPRPHLPPEQGSTPRRFVATGALYKPLRREDEPLFSNLWFIAPVVFNIFGGIIAYFAIKNLDERSARKMLAIGAFSFLAVAGGFGYYAWSQGLLSFDKKVESPSGIIIEGAESEALDEIAPFLNGTAKINATLRSASEMNLNLEDLEPEFYINPLLTGVLDDPLEFTGGNRTLALELEREGWLENHRIVMKKDFIGKGNATIAEKEIDSSISKYNASTLSPRFFEKRLESFKRDLNDSGYLLVDFRVNDSGVMGKKVQPDPDYDIRVSYKVFFYKQDSAVSLFMSKVGRGLGEEEVMGIARVVEGRVE